MQEALPTFSCHDNHANRGAREQDFEIGLSELLVVSSQNQKIWAPARVELPDDDHVRLVADGFDQNFLQHAGEPNQDDLDGRPVVHAPDRTLAPCLTGPPSVSSRGAWTTYRSSRS